MSKTKLAIQVRPCTPIIFGGNSSTESTKGWQIKVVPLQVRSECVAYLFDIEVEIEGRGAWNETLSREAAENFFRGLSAGASLFGGCSIITAQLPPDEHFSLTRDEFEES